MKTSRLPRCTLAWVSAVGLATTLASCGSATTAPGQTTAASTIFTSLQQRGEGIDAIYTGQILSDYLPNQTFAIDGRAAIPLATGIVTGDVTDAEVSYAAKITTGDDGEEDPAGSAVLPLTSPEADWRIVTVTLEVDQAWGDTLAAAKEVEFSVPLGGSSDVDEALAGLRSLDDIVVILEPRRDSTLKDGVYRIARNATTLGQIEDGRLTFPAMEDEDEAAFLGTISTLDDLDHASQVERTPIVVNDFIRATP